MSQQRDESFSRKYRLHRSNDFRRVFSRGKRIVSKSFVIYAAPGAFSYSRMAIQVRAKIGKAGRRNYIKRIVREVFRRRQRDFHRPMDMIIIAEKGMSDIRFRQFQEEFARALEKYVQ